MDGVSATVNDLDGAALSIQSTGTVTAPMALVAYPGATATIGTDSLTYALRVPNISVTADYWVIAGFHFHGLTALSLGRSTGTHRQEILTHPTSLPPPSP